jgi:hypothetical protein
MTTEEELLKEPNIIRCAVKKTASVIAKHILLMSYAIVALAVIAIGYLGFTNLALPAILWVAISAAFYCGCVIGVLLSVAWYWYALVLISTTYFGYGFLWCVARELVDEDWRSDEADAVAAAVAAFAFAAAAFVFAAVATVAFAFAFAAFAVAVAAVAAVAVAAVAVADDYNGTSSCKIVRFVGAYLHYYRRTHKEKTP